MDFRISDTFTGSLAKLTGEEQKAVKTTAFDLQMNPANPGIRLHRVDRTKDANFWSARVNRDVRMIVHRTSSSLMLCYVGHHDDAYAWAERRKIERHPKTGAAQLVEVREVVHEVPVIMHVAEPSVTALEPLFTDVSDDDLLQYGVPEEWLSDVRGTNEDSVLDVADRLPAEAAEALLALAVGESPKPPLSIPVTANEFEHPDAQRRFRVVTDVDELERALDYPWEKWSVFLHPAQRGLVEETFDGPARVAGSAGTGKTVVALHRAAHLTRSNLDARVLLTTYSEPLAVALRTKVRRLIGTEPHLAERLDVHALPAIAKRLFKPRFGSARLVDDATIAAWIEEATSEVDESRLTSGFLFNEWRTVVDPWQLDSWEAYRDVPRLGRRVRLSERQREQAWAVFSNVLSRLEERDELTKDRLLTQIGEALTTEGAAPYRYVVVDEAQDLGVAEMRFIAALGAPNPDSLFLASDLGQRIFQTPFSWKDLGVDVRGRSFTLHINYRTSHQIRQQVDRLLPAEMSDVDGITDARHGTVSAFNGPRPVVDTFIDIDGEISAVGAWVSERIADDVAPKEIAVFVRSSAELPRAQRALSDAGVLGAVLDERLKGTADHVSIATMHVAKGLEFLAVAIMACDDEVLPLQSRIETVSEESELEEAYRTERHLLYVACTRAREHLLVTGVDPASEFLEDLEA